jgi:hypothetical protein
LVLGLDESDVLISIAPRITIPVEFVMQWDDAGHPRDSMLTLFDALGSTEKTLHASPGSNTSDFRCLWLSGVYHHSCSLSVLESVFVAVLPVCGHGRGPRVAAGLARGSTARGPGGRGGSS